MTNLSIKDIAQELKLSKATVSWILSGQGDAKGFSDKTIKRVKEYAESVNYRPNLLARSLSIGSSNTVGLIIPFIGDTFYAQLIQSIELELSKNKYALIVCSSEGDSKKESELIRMLKSKQVDGIIIAPTKKSIGSVSALIRESFPFVLVDRYFPELDTNYVIVDNEQSSYYLVKHLLDTGAKKIALLTTDIHLFVMDLRTSGYRRAVEEAGCTSDKCQELIIKRENYRQDIKDQLAKLLKEEPTVDSFFFTTHYLALEAIRFFLENRIDYHHRFKLACFHTTTALDILAPEMYIAHMPIDAIGIKTVRMLIENMKERNYVTQGIVLRNSFSF